VTGTGRRRGAPRLACWRCWRAARPALRDPRSAIRARPAGSRTCPSPGATASFPSTAVASSGSAATVGNAAVAARHGTCRTSPRRRIPTSGRLPRLTSARVPLEWRPSHPTDPSSDRGVCGGRAGAEASTDLGGARVRDSDRYVTRKRWVRGVALGAVVAMGAALGAVGTASATAPSQNGGKPKTGGSITYGLEAPTTNFCLPNAQLAISGIAVTTAVYDTLTVPDKDGKYVPYLAESVNPS